MKLMAAPVPTPGAVGGGAPRLSANAARFLGIQDQRLQDIDALAVNECALGFALVIKDRAAIGGRQARSVQCLLHRGAFGDLDGFGAAVAGRHFYPGDGDLHESWKSRNRRTRVPR